MEQKGTVQVTASDLSNTYLWFDTEFTSLDLERSSLLQVALVVTNHELKRLAPPERDFSCVVRLANDQRADAWVEEHLADLVTRCRSDEAIVIDEVDRRLDAYLEDVVGASPREVTNRPVLAGNSLHCDWYLARKFLPSLISRAHYRVLDVSSWKVVWKNTTGTFPFDKEDEGFVRRYFPGEFNSSAEMHDAHFDVLASIAELNFYLQHSRIDLPIEGVAR